MKKFHYEYFVYTDNLNYGRTYIGKDRSSTTAYNLGRRANKGCFVVEKHRVYESKVNNDGDNTADD